jgi:hypothetical protein
MKYCDHRQTRRRTASVLLSILVATLACACTATKSAQETAKLSAQSLNEFKSRLNEFVEEEDSVQANNLARLKELQLETNAMRTDSNQTVEAWQVAGDKTASSMYQALSQTKAADIAPQSSAMMILEPSATVPSTQVSQQQFDNVVKELNAIGADQSLRDQLSAYVDYGHAVYSAYNSDMSSAKDGVKKTGAKQQSMTQTLKSTTNSAMSN